MKFNLWSVSKSSHSSIFSIYLWTVGRLSKIHPWSSAAFWCIHDRRRVFLTLTASPCCVRFKGSTKISSPADQPTWSACGSEKELKECIELCMCMCVRLHTHVAVSMLHLKENKRHCQTFLCPHHTKEVPPPSPTVTTTYVAWPSSEIVQFCSSF